MTAATRATLRTLTTDDAADAALVASRLGGRETAAAWSAFLGRPETFAVCALAEGRIVGYAAGGIRGGFGLPEPAGWVEAFGIALSERGHGVGRALLQDLFARLRAGGARHVYTLVPVHDLALAPFFRQAGLRDEPLACLGAEL